MIKINHNYSGFEWIQVVNPEPSELQELHDHYQLSFEMLDYATDNFESPRYTHDPEADLIILNGIITNESGKIEIQPIAFFIQNPARLITFTNRNASSALEDTIQKTPKSYLESNIPSKTQPIDLVLNAFFNFTNDYLNALGEIERKRNLLQQEIYHHRNSEYLSELLNVKIKLIYDLNSLERNKTTLDQFKEENQQKIDASEKEFLEDIEIEMKQALDMANISTKIMNLLSDAYENIINNKTNRSMSILTVASIILAIPAIIVGFFGMNVDLPGAKGGFSWLLITLGTIALMVWVYQALKHHDFFN